MYVLCLQLSQMCPFPESFLRAISSAEEFSPLPIASSTTGGLIILIPYRDGEGERWWGWGGGIKGSFKGHSLPSYTIAFLKKEVKLYQHSRFGDWSRSHYFLANLSCLRQSCIVVLPDYWFKSPDCGITVKTRTRFKMLFDHFFLSGYFKSNFGLIRRRAAHTPASCKTLAKQLQWL